MTAPFNRRDSSLFAILAGLLAPVVTLSLPSGPHWGWPALSLAGATMAVTLLVLFAWLRRLPPDLTLQHAPEEAARQAVAPPSPGVARLRVALLPEPLSWYRLDLYLDGARIGQLRPGMALVRSMPPGPHELSLQAWLRRLGPGERINAVSGTDTDIVIRVQGRRSRHYSIMRRDVAAVLADAEVVLVEAHGTTRPTRINGDPASRPGIRKTAPP